MEDPCANWAMLLPDAAEGLLGDAEQGAVDRHVASCAACARELADAQRGAAWLGMLKTHAPEPPANLLSSILAQTTGAEATTVESDLAEAMPGATVPVRGYVPDGAFGWPVATPQPQGVLATFAEQVGRWFGVGGELVPRFQPRLAMTAAMAFFSICLTLNLLGVTAGSLRANGFGAAGAATHRGRYRGVAGADGRGHSCGLPGGVARERVAHRHCSAERRSARAGAVSEGRECATARSREGVRR